MGYRLKRTAIGTGEIAQPLGGASLSRIAGGTNDGAVEEGGLRPIGDLRDWRPPLRSLTALDRSNQRDGLHAGVASSNGLTVSRRTSDPSARITNSSPFCWGLPGCNSASSR
jgi:hypothetical protein